MTALIIILATTQGFAFLYLWRSEHNRITNYGQEQA